MSHAALCFRKDEFSTWKDRFNVPSDEDSCISSLQSNRKSLEEMFDFHGWGLSSSSSFYGGQLFKERGGDWVPSAKRFDDEGLEEYAPCAVMFKMRTITALSQVLVIVGTST